jgi:hypothetical protein
MHEESLGTVIRDYLTGEELVETSYEEFRQGLARLLVEERGYPRERLTPKVGVCFPAQGSQYTRMVDLAATDETGRVLLFIIFCSGEPGSYRREALAAARVYDQGPAPLALVTDTREALLLDVASGREIGRGMCAVPRYEALAALAGPLPPLSAEALDREQRILFAYSELLADGCCQGACRPKART